MDRDKMEEIALKEKAKRISMNNVPQKTRELFIELANENFGENYGSCLKWCLEQALEYQDMKATFFGNIDMKLDNMQHSINQLNTEKVPESSGVTMLSGKKRRIG